MTTCSRCHGNLSTPAVGAMHMTSMSGDLICGVTGKTALVVHEADPPTVHEADRDRVLAARAALVPLLQALENHEAVNDTPCEVRGKDGWVDVLDLAVAIGQALA